LPTQQKRGFKMFTQGLTLEVGTRDITVNDVQPGAIDTDMNPAAVDCAVPQKAVTALNCYGHVDDIAAMVAFVGGPEGSDEDPHLKMQGKPFPLWTIH